MEDRVSAGAATPLALLQVDTPTSRVRIERLNKGSAVLTRCPDVDQSAYEPVFHQASDIMAQYRAALGLRNAFRSDIAWLNADAPKRQRRPQAQAGRGESTETKSKVMNLMDAMENSVRDTVVLGTGCAGLTAAIYAARANLKPLVIEGHEPGGQLSLTTLVENFPGFPEGIQGPELIENMRKQAARFGAEYMRGHLVKADLNQRPFKLDFGGGKTVLDAHAHHRQRSFRAMAGTAERARADRPWRFFLRHLRRLFLQRQADYGDRRRRLRHGRSVVPHPLCHQGDDHPSARSLPRLQDHAGPRAQAREDRIPHRHDGGRCSRRRARKKLPRSSCKNVKTGKVWDFPTSAMFLGIGHEPNAKMFAGQLDMDEDGYLKTRDFVMTRVPGVFACGDVQDRRYRQAITAAGSGCAAAMEAEKFLEEHGR